MKSDNATAPELRFHLRWVGKIALAVGLLAAGGLTVTLHVLTDASGSTYGALIQSHSMTQQQLAPALVVGGLFLLALSGVLTWLISLYSSFRIAGPLYRLALNLEGWVQRGPGQPVPIRKSDGLQDEAKLLESSVKAVAAHYAAIDAVIAQALAQDEASGGLDEAAWRANHERLTALTHDVQI